MSALGSACVEVLSNLKINLSQNLITGVGVWLAAHPSEWVIDTEVRVCWVRGFLFGEQVRGG